MSALGRAEAPSPQRPAGPDAFVSYAREDGAFVARLVEALEARGAEIWIDRDDVRKSEDWWARILVGIGSAKCVIAVVSPDFAASETCAREIARAVEQRKRLIPVVRGDAELNRLPGALTALDFIFCRDGDDFGAAVDQLRGALAGDLDWLDAHARLTVRATEWDAAERDSSLLLRRRDLQAAEARLAEQASHAEPLTELQVEYILAGRRAEQRRRRITLGAVVAALAVAVVLAVVAWVLRGEARHQAALSRSRELASTSAAQIGQDPELSLLLGIAADDAARTPESVAAIRQALARSRVRLRLTPPGGAVPRVAVAGTRMVASGAAATTLADARTAQAVRTLPGVRAALSAAGDRVVTVDRHGRAVFVFDAASGRRLAVLSAPGVAIEGARFASGAKWVAASARTRAQEPRTVVWRGADPVPVATLSGTMVAASPAQPLIAVEGPSPLRIVRLTRAGPKPGPAIARPADTVAAAFDAEGRRFAALLGGGIVTVRDPRHSARRERPDFSARPRDLTDVAVGWPATLSFSPHGSLLAVQIRPQLNESGGGPTQLGTRRATVVDLRKGRVVAELKGHAALLDGIAFSPDGSQVVTCDDDGTARVWAPRTSRSLMVLSGHQGPVTACAFVAPGRAMTSGADGTARVWDTTGVQPAWTAAGDAAAVPDAGRVVAVAGGDGTTAVLNAHSGASLRSWRRDSRAVSALHVDDRGAAVAVDTLGETSLWSSATGAQIGSYAGETRGLSHDGRFAVVTGIGLVDMRGPAPRVRHLRGDLSTIQRAIFSRDDRLVATLTGTVQSFGGDAPPRIWSTSTGKLVHTLGRYPYVYAGAFTPDARRFATGGEDGVVRIWDVRSGRLLTALRPTAERVLTLAFDGEGTSLAAAIRGPRVFVWNLTAAGTPLVLRHSDNVLDAAFSPDGSLLLTSSEMGVAHVWDRSSGRLLLSVPAQHARFSADGRSVIVADGTAERPRVGAYACDVCGAPDDVVALARTRVTRALTPSERRTYLHER